MGQAFRKLFDTFFGNKEMRILSKLIWHEHTQYASYHNNLDSLDSGNSFLFIYAGFNVEKVQYKNVIFTVWDVGGQEKLRPLWRHYFNNTDGLRGAMTPVEVCEGLGLYDVRNRVWHIQGTCALRGDGLYEGLDWLASTLNELQTSSRSTSVGSSSF
ncbi:hypothetical protein C4D60_Mb04t34600 [Musa balbisiana]|uniref:ADP-ribosylation factor n=1 Tax=Musa balbisiana TaxID=52838 RepID=A0A4S8KGR9_MUSBA|nr:hypothetical protein C4D60_Mb04t34600 [Musa balbisiana]